MSENKKTMEAYAMGFKDGWQAAMEQIDKLPPNRNHLQPHMWKDLKIDPPPGTSYFKCPVCGAFGTTGVVCYNHNCPTKITSGAGAIGAQYNVGVGGIGTTVPATVGGTGGLNE
jgi:hypothetical protein